VNQHLAKAIAIYEQHGIDFQQFLAWHLCHGVVVCDMDCFAMGFCCDKENPTPEACLDYGDTLFVTFCTGSMSSMLKAFNGKFKYVAFQRDMKNSPRLRLWDYQKTLRKTSHGITI